MALVAAISYMFFFMFCIMLVVDVAYYVKINSSHPPSDEALPWTVALSLIAFAFCVMTVFICMMRGEQRQCCFCRRYRRDQRNCGQHNRGQHDRDQGERVQRRNNDNNEVRTVVVEINNQSSTLEDDNDYEKICSRCSSRCRSSVRSGCSSSCRRRSKHIKSIKYTKQ